MSFFRKSFCPSNHVQKLQKRSLTDRSFRLANVSDLRVAQEMRNKVVHEHYFAGYAQTSQLFKPRDLSKQVVIDLSHEQGYRRGHIKGAVNLPIERLDFTRKVDVFGGISKEEVEQAMKNLGVTNETSDIVLYDNSGLLSCRLFFVLRYFGMTNIRILNGGWRAWLRTGLPVDETIPVVKVSPSAEIKFKPKRVNMLTKPTQMIFDHEHETSTIIDTRSPDAYQKYHISRAINIPIKNLMTDAVFAQVKEVRETLQKHNIDLETTKPIVVYSSKGLTSSVAYFCLTMAGLDKVSIYDSGIYNWASNFDSKLSPDAIEHLER